MKRSLKLIVAYVLHWLGVLRLRQAMLMRRRAVVLMYHRVLTADERRQTGSHPAIVVDRDVFAEQMAILKRHFVVLSIDEFASFLERQEPFPDSACLITFDDGWSDNFRNAWPILQQQRVPALIFLPVNYIGAGRLFWREELTNLLASVLAEVERDPTRRARFAELLAPAGLGHVLEIEHADPRPELIDLVEQWRGADLDTKELVACVGAELGDHVVPHPDAFMDWRQVAAMSEAGIAFGGHTVEHRILTELSDAEARSEIGGSKQALDARLELSSPSFSYPNGAWNARLAALVREAGYRFAFTTKAGYVDCAADPFSLVRINIDAQLTHTPLFLARLVGLF